MRIKKFHQHNNKKYVKKINKINKLNRKLSKKTPAVQQIALSRILYALQNMMWRDYNNITAFIDKGNPFLITYKKGKLCIIIII